MKLGQSDVLPLADSGGRSLLVDRDGIAYGTANRYQGWQRAMEQAELAGWFKAEGEDAKGQSGNQGGHEAPARSPIADTHSSVRDRRSVSSPHAQMPASAIDVVTDATASMPQQAVGRGSDSATFSAPSPARAVGVDQSSAAVPPMVKAEPATVANTACLPPQRLPDVWPGAATVTPHVEQWSGLIAQLRQAVLDPGRGALDGAIKATERLASPVLRSASLGTTALPHASDAVQGEVVDGIESEIEATSPSSSEEARSSAPPNPPVRIHVEWAEQGARVWLGVDGDESAVLPEIRRQLDRMLSESGHQLLSLVCNGRTVADGTAGSWNKRASLGKLYEGQYRQVLQSGDWSADQSMFHLYEQGAR